MMPKRHRWLAAALLTVAGCAQAPERVVEPRTTTQAAPRGSVLLRAAMLAGQNRAREDVGVAALTWSEPLAASARAYADTLARSGRFEHAAQPMGPGRQGENLWTGTRGAYRFDEMVGHWVAERRDFVNIAVPQSSRTGRWADVGHYSQIVWRGTSEVGCALASNATDDYLVCRYAAPGNVMGSAAY